MCFLGNGFGFKGLLWVLRGPKRPQRKAGWCVMVPGGSLQKTQQAHQGWIMWLVSRPQAQEKSRYRHSKLLHPSQTGPSVTGEGVKILNVAFYPQTFTLKQKSNFSISLFFSLLLSLSPLCSLAYRKYCGITIKMYYDNTMLLDITTVQYVPDITE